MQGLSKQRALESLRARLESIEKRPTTAQESIGAETEAHLLETPAGILHEIFTSEHRDAAASFGFALGQAQRLLDTKRLVVFVLQLAHDGNSLGIPYGSGLKSFGIDPEAIVLGRIDNPIDLLWAAEEAVSCRAVAAVIVDIATPMKALDFTASRRLSLRAAAAGCSAFILRYGREREATAARFRWQVMPVPSAPAAFDARAPAQSRWHVHLEKGRLGSRSDPVEWILDWTPDGFALVESQNRSKAAATIGKALSRPAFAALGDRLSKAS